jgi:hypothetical protein
MVVSAGTCTVKEVVAVAMPAAAVLLDCCAVGVLLPPQPASPIAVIVASVIVLAEKVLGCK